MRLKTMPKDVACELLAYLSENGEFESICKSLGGEITDLEVRALLRELAVILHKELRAETGDAYDFKACRHLSKDVKKIISYLSPHEEKTLLTAFGLADAKEK